MQATVGDQVQLDGYPITAENGYSLIGSTVRVILYVGRIAAPFFRVEVEGEWDDDLTAESGTVLATIAPEDWGEYAPTGPVPLNVQVEVTGAAGAWGPATVHPPAIDLLPDADSGA